MLAVEAAELLPERRRRDDRLGHRAVAAGVADPGEAGLDEVAGVAGVAEVAHRHDDVAVDHAGDDRPFDVLELEQEVGHVRDEVLARRVAEVGREDLIARPALLDRPRHELQPLARDLRPFHLAHQRGVGQRVQERERLEVHPVGVAAQEQRVRLDRVQQRRGGPFRDVGADRPQVLGEDRRRRPVVGPDVLERGGVAGLFRVMVDDQVGSADQAAEVVRLHVDGGDPVVVGQRLRRHRFDGDVEQVGHPQVLGPGHALERADDRRRLRPVQQVAQREAAAHRIRIGVVVEQDQHPVRVGEVPLVLLNPRPRQRPAEGGHQRVLEQLPEAKHRHVGEVGPPGVGARRRVADPQHVHQGGAGVGGRLQDPPQAALAVVLDDHAGGRRDVGLEETGDPPRVGHADVDAGVVQAAGRRPVVEQELQIEAGRQRPVQDLDDEDVLTDGDAPHEEHRLYDAARSVLACATLPG